VAEASPSDLWRLHALHAARFYPSPFRSRPSSLRRPSFSFILLCSFIPLSSFLISSFRLFATFPTETPTDYFVSLSIIIVDALPCDLGHRQAALSKGNLRHVILACRAVIEARCATLYFNYILDASLIPFILSIFRESSEMCFRHRT
jgi:hypothetical protein